MPNPFKSSVLKINLFMSNNPVREPPIYALIGFSSAYSFIFLSLLSPIIGSRFYTIGFAQVIIAFTTSLFKLLAPASTRHRVYTYVGAVNSYTVLNILSVIALTYAVTYAFGVTDFASITIAVVSTYTVFFTFESLKLPTNIRVPAILALSLIGGGLMTMIDIALVVLVGLITI